MSPLVLPQASVLSAVNRVDALTAGPEQRLEFVFPVCYTAGRHEVARRELMKEPADRAVVLLQRVSELLLESRRS